MTLDIMSWQPFGDETNPDFFNAYRLKICERRRAGGLGELLRTICGLVVQVDLGDALPYPLARPKPKARYVGEVFATRDVAALTEAAGRDERYEHGRVFD